MTTATAETELTTADSPAEAESSSGLRGVPTIVRRRLSTLDAGLNPYSWIITAIIVTVAAILRFAGVSNPKGYIFDEVYYPTDAWDMLQHGVEWDEKTNGPAYVVHPPLGKWLIAFGESIFGNNELGWRFSTALAGTVMVLVLIRLAYRLFHSIVLAGTVRMIIAAFIGWSAVSWFGAGLATLFQIVALAAVSYGLLTAAALLGGAWGRRPANQPLAQVGPAE